MSSKSRPKKLDDLMAVIQRQVPTHEEPPASAAIMAEGEQELPVSHRASRTTAAAPKNRVGRPVQFWLHDEDRKLVRELAAWLAGQGLRPTDSLVIRSALRTAKTGGDLLKAYEEASLMDGRLKRHKHHK